MRSICHVAVRMRIKEPNDLPACCLPAKNFFLKISGRLLPSLLDGRIPRPRIHTAALRHFLFFGIGSAFDPSALPYEVKQSVERGCGSRRPAAAHVIIYPPGFEPSSPRLPIFPQSSSLFCFPLFPIFLIIKTFAQEVV